MLTPLKAPSASAQPTTSSLARHQRARREDEEAEAEERAGGGSPMGAARGRYLGDDDARSVVASVASTYGQKGRALQSNLVKPSQT
jgi:hypothetical protein